MREALHNALDVLCNAGDRIVGWTHHARKKLNDCAIESAAKVWTSENYFDLYQANKKFRRYVSGQREFPLIPFIFGCLIYFSVLMPIIYFKDADGLAFAGFCLMLCTACFLAACLIDIIAPEMTRIITEKMVEVTCRRGYFRHDELIYYKRSQGMSTLGKSKLCQATSEQIFQAYIQLYGEDKVNFLNRMSAAACDISARTPSGFISEFARNLQLEFVDDLSTFPCCLDSIAENEERDYLVVLELQEIDLYNRDSHSFPASYLFQAEKNTSSCNPRVHI